MAAPALSDPGTYHALWLSVQVMVLSWLVQMPISLLLGTFIATSGKYRALLGVLYFLPMLLSSAAIAIAFKALLDPNFGMSLAFGVDAFAQDWLGDRSLALYVAPAAAVHDHHVVDPHALRLADLLRPRVRAHGGRPR